MSDWFLQNGAYVAIVFFATLVLTLTLVYFISDHRRKKQAYKQVFRDRPSMSASDYHERFFAGSEVTKTTTALALEILEHETALDFTRISPDEYFGGALGILMDGLDFTGIILSTEKSFGFRLSDAEALSASTPRKLIELVTQKLIEESSASIR